MRTKKTRTERSPKVAVIVLNYNGKQFLDDCLSSLKRQSLKDYQVWVLDNASSDDSIDYIKKRYPWVKVIENKRNDGTAEGSNVAARKTESEYIIFMSNDIKADKNCLKYLVETLDEDEKVGLCSSKLLRFDKDPVTGKFIIDNVGGRIDIYGFPAAIGHNEIDSGQWNNLKEVFFSFGGSFIIRREVFEKIGEFDSKYFTLSDDMDLSWRTWLAGYRVVVNPASFVHHKVSATLGPLLPRADKRYLSEKNIFRTLVKNYDNLTLLKILPRYFFLLTLEIGFYLVKGRFDLAQGIVKAFFWNLANLSDTLRKHREIQRTRVINDREIVKGMNRRSIKLSHFRELSRGL